MNTTSEVLHTHANGRLWGAVIFAAIAWLLLYNIIQPLSERFAIEHATLQPEPETRTVRWLGARGGESTHNHPPESSP